MRPRGRVDCCPSDPDKTEVGVCGCGLADTDSDTDGSPNCIDTAPYGWRKRLTLDGAQITGPLTDFPVLIRITDAQLGSLAASDGSDIHFYAADQTSLLAHEIESYGSATGALVAWVLSPTLTTATDSVLYLGYDDGKADRSNPTSLWAGHHYVWHLSQDPGPGGTGDIKDAAQHANGTAQASMTSANLVTAVVGNGISFDGIDDEISFTNDFSGSGPSTISAWVNQTAAPPNYGSSVISYGNDATNQSRFIITLENSTGFMKAGFYGNDIYAGTFATGAWKHLVWTWDGSHTRIYVDGALVTGPSVHPNPSGAPNTNGTDGKIGNSTSVYDFSMLGRLDEIRVATQARSAAWVLTEFRNQRSGSTFLKTVETQVAAPAH